MMQLISFHGSSLSLSDYDMSRVVSKPAFCICENKDADELRGNSEGGKPAFCICENKDADQLRGNREADQRLLFSLHR